MKYTSPKLTAEQRKRMERLRVEVDAAKDDPEQWERAYRRYLEEQLKIDLEVKAMMDGLSASSTRN